STDEWRQVTVHGMDEGFIDGSTLAFQARAEGYESDEAIVEALKTDPNVAVISRWYLGDSQATSGNGEDTMLKLDGLTASTDTFAPVQVELARPDGTTSTVTVIGVIDETLGVLNGLYASQATVDAVYTDTVATSYYIALEDADA